MNNYDLKKHAGYGACTFLDASLLMFATIVLVDSYFNDAGLDKLDVAVARGITIFCILSLLVKFTYDMHMVKKYDDLMEEQE